MRWYIVRAQFDLAAGASTLLRRAEARLPGIAGHTVPAFDQAAINTWRRRRVLLAGVTPAPSRFQSRSVIAWSDQDFIRPQVSGDASPHDDVFGELASLPRRRGLGGRLDDFSSLLQRVSSHVARQDERDLVEAPKQLLEAGNA